LRRFLGLIGYYHILVKGYANIASSLIDLLKKDSFFHTHVTLEVFRRLKIAPTLLQFWQFPTSVLLLFWKKNASGLRIGVVLRQEHNLIAYFTKKLSLYFKINRLISKIFMHN